MKCTRFFCCHFQLIKDTKYSVGVLRAETGSGKTTTGPTIILEEYEKNGVADPRIVVICHTRASSRFVTARSLDTKWTLGEEWEIGYAISKDKETYDKNSNNILYITLGKKK